MIGTSMEPASLAARLAQALKGMLLAAWEILPPYRMIEGRLTTKDRAPDGMHYILVEEQIVEVDWFTFGKLMPGEAVRIRMTRKNKAISIDRLLP